MGNTGSVVMQKRLTRFRGEERAEVEGLFDKLREKGSDADARVLTLHTLKVCLQNVSSDSMASRVFEGMRSVTVEATPPDSGISQEQLVVFLADVLRGTAEERAPIVMAMTQGAGSTVTSVDQIRGFLEDLVSAVVQTMTHRGHLQGWRPDCMGESTQGVKVLAEHLSSELKLTDQQTCDVPCLEDWLFRVPNVALYLELVVGAGLEVGLSSRQAAPLLPPCGTPWGELRCLLDLPLIMFLMPLLPDAHGAPWRLLFSTQVHGESFTKLMGSVVRRGPTLLLLRDTLGHTFGGFASHSWEIKPQFQGDSRCFLFTAWPFLRVYTCTGYNNHYMYLNHGQQTMPNGLGMGGQHEYFGLWLGADFGRGHSRAQPRCTTFGSPQLSGEDEFSVDALEVWAVGQPPQELEEGEGRKSVLDADPELQAMMEITGKTCHSAGLREPEED